MKAVKMCMVLVACIISSNKVYAENINNNTCDLVFASYFKALMDKRKNIDIASLGESFADGMRISAEEMMLSLSSFDSEGCSSETRKRIQTLFEHAARMQSSYEKFVELDIELHNAKPEELKAEIKKALQQRQKANRLFEAFLEHNQIMHSYVLQFNAPNDLHTQNED